MARELYLAILLLALLHCLYALPVQAVSQGGSGGLARSGVEERTSDARARMPFTTADNLEEEDACSNDNEEDGGYHNGLRRRCIGKPRKLSWPWGRKQSQSEGEDTKSSDSLISAEQQLHFMNLHAISLIQDPDEKAEAEAAESQRRRQQEVVLRQIR